MGRLEDIRRLRERMSTGKLSAEEARRERLALKNRILGTLLEDARLASGRSPAEAAAILDIPEATYRSFESGEQTPSLPQLEVLSYLYNVPIRHFWGTETLAAERHEDEIRRRVPEVLMLRRRILGVRLRQLRDESGRTLEEIAEETGLSADTIEAVERGEQELSMGELELLTQALKARLDDLLDGHGPIGSWLQAQDDFAAFADLPAEMREFILKPINRSYLDLAMRLSRMEVNRLRGIAESILEITL